MQRGRARDVLGAPAVFVVAVPITALNSTRHHQGAGFAQ